MNILLKEVFITKIQQLMLVSVFYKVEQGD